MASEKIFVVVEAIDKPAGAMLVRYSVVERVEPDPEEQRLASVPMAPATRPPGVDQETWEMVQTQLSAADAIYKSQKVDRVTYRTEEKVAICTKTEEIAAAIIEAKEQYEEIRKLKKSGARFELSVPSFKMY